MIPLASKYQVFCQAVSRKSFTEAAKVLHHSQSAVSQAVKAVEQEVGLTLVLRKKDDIELTSDGKKVYPYIQNICDAEMALAHKTFEMEQLQGGIVRIGTFPTVSREALPALMKQFKAEHPSVCFVLYQGEYTSIASMLQSGKVEIGFSHLGFCEEFEAVPLFRDPLAAVLPPEHSLAKQSEITLEQFSTEPLIILDEGKRSVIKDAFANVSLSPWLESRVYDCDTIMAMVERGLGVSLLYRSYLKDYTGPAVVLPIRERPERHVAITWKRGNVLSYATRKFMDHMADYYRTR